MPDQTDEPLAESDRMLRDAVAALNVADSALLDSGLEPYRLEDWSDTDPSSTGRLASMSAANAKYNDSSKLDSLGHAQEQLRIELGRTRIPLQDLYALDEHSLLILDNSERELVDLYAGETLLAKGEVVCLEGRICFRVVELIDRRSEPSW